MASRLLDLPTELLVRIASYLTTKELGPLRQTAKAIENALFDSFSREFFTKRQFMLEHESLEALAGIANHPGLSPRLTEVLIGTDTLSYVNNAQLAVDRFDRGHVSRQTLLHTGLAREMLADAFSKLPNLRTVGLRDYDGKDRIRDGPSARWRPWGWTVSRRTEQAHPSTILPLIVSALGAARARPTNVEVILRRAGGNHLTHTAFELPTSKAGADVVPMLAHLETLMLAIQSHDLTIPPGAAADSKACEAPLQRFLHYTSNLKTLRLNFKVNQTTATSVIEWLGAPATSTPIDFKQWPLPSVALESLTTLDFGMANVPASALRGALLKFKSLQSFSLHKVALQPQSASQDAWAAFLESLSTSLPNPSRLRSIMIGDVYQSNFALVYGSNSNVLFVPEGTTMEEKRKDKALEKTVRVRFQAKYTAKTVHEWLEELSERTFVDYLYQDSESEAQDQDEDEDEDEVSDEEDEDE